jgi:hypothetical protein
MYVNGRTSESFTQLVKEVTHWLQNRLAFGPIRHLIQVRGIAEQSPAPKSSLRIARLRTYTLVPPTSAIRVNCGACDASDADLRRRGQILRRMRRARRTYPLTARRDSRLVLSCDTFGFRAWISANRNNALGMRSGCFLEANI